MDVTQDTSSSQIVPPPAQPPRPEPERARPAKADSQQAAVTADQPSSAAMEQAGTATGASARIEMAKTWARRLKPVAVAAESIAARAVDLSARGLTRLIATMNERRRRRQAEANPEQRGDNA